MTKQVHQQAQADVLVVGGGPVGLMTAMELGWRGHRVLLLDEGDGAIRNPRALLVSIRTMEHCRRWGIADRVRNLGFPKGFPMDVVFCTSMKGFELCRAKYPPLDSFQPNYSPEQHHRCPQQWFDPLMAEIVDEFDHVTICRRSRVTSLDTSRPDGVAARFEDLDTGTLHTVEANYAIVCEGAGSRTRSDLGIELAGTRLMEYCINVTFTAPDLLRLTGQDMAARYLMFNQEGAKGAITAIDGLSTWRLSKFCGRERLNLDAIDPVAEVMDFIGTEVPIEVVTWAPWRRSQLLADRYSSGRVFLAGDAVHTMSPTGGYGANTGYGDAVDIGWKLDAVIKGWGGPELLDSYTVERRPIALRSASVATGNYKGWYTDADFDLMAEGEAADAARRALGHRIVEATQAEWKSDGVSLGYRYEGSPICVPDGSPVPNDSFTTYEQDNRAGGRAPHVWLAPGKSTLDLFGRGMVLINVGARATTGALVQAASAAGIPLSVHAIAADLPGVEAYSTALTLVRPDGHVAWRGERLPDNPAALLQTVVGAQSDKSHSQLVG